MDSGELILPIDNHKLVMIYAPEIATDRGFIRFFSDKERLIDNDSLLVSATKDYGNSLSTKIVELVLGADTTKMVTVQPDTIDLASVHTRSWFNDMFSPHSVVFFDYKDTKTSELQYALAAVHWTSDDNDALLVSAISNTTVLSIPTEIGQLF